MRTIILTVILCVMLGSAAHAAPSVYIRSKPVHEPVLTLQGKFYLPLEILNKFLDIKLEIKGSLVRLNGKALPQAPVYNNGIYYIAVEEAARAAGFEYQYSQATEIVDVYKAKKPVTDSTPGQVISVSGTTASGQVKIKVKPMGLDALEELKSYNKGKILILDFWATWCSPCRKEIPDFIELYNEYGSKGVAIVGLSIDTGDTEYVQKFVDEPFGDGSKINYPVYVVNDEVTDKYNIGSIPATYIYNRSGELVHTHVGLTRKEVFEAEIKALLP